MGSDLQVIIQEEVRSCWGSCVVMAFSVACCSFCLVMDCTNKLRGKKEQFELDYSCSVLSIYLPKCFCGEPIVSEDMDMYCQQCTEDSKEFRS